MVHQTLQMLLHHISHIWQIHFKMYYIKMIQHYYQQHHNFNNHKLLRLLMHHLGVKHHIIIQSKERLDVFRKFWIFSLLRCLETIYLFLFMRKVLIKLGLIQSPLQEYLRAILPPQVYKAMVNAKISNLHPYHYLPSWLPYFGAQSEQYRKTHSSNSNHTESVAQYYEKDSSSRKHPRAMNLDDLQDVIRENPMTKEEIYRKILDHMEKAPESYSSTSSSGTPTYLYQY
eukprot:UN03212